MSTYDEIQEVDRVLARRERGEPAFDGGCVLPMGGTPFVLKAGERVLTRADRPKVAAREVADRIEAASKITSETGE